LDLLISKLDVLAVRALVDHLGQKSLTLAIVVDLQVNGFRSCVSITDGIVIPILLSL
jgi:hypothetical protein